MSKPPRPVQSPESATARTTLEGLRCTEDIWTRSFRRPSFGSHVHNHGRALDAALSSERQAWRSLAIERRKDNFYLDVLAGPPSDGLLRYAVSCLSNPRQLVSLAAANVGVCCAMRHENRGNRAASSAVPDNAGDGESAPTFRRVAIEPRLARVSARPGPETFTLSRFRGTSFILLDRPSRLISQRLLHLHCVGAMIFLDRTGTPQSTTRDFISSDTP